MPADVQPFQPRGPSVFHGPFIGLNTDLAARNLSAGHAADCSNVIVRYGVVTHRPGLNLIHQELSNWDDFHGIGLRYFDGSVDYVVGVSKDQKVGLWPYDEHFQPTLLAIAGLTAPFTKCRGAIGRFGQDAYIATDTGVMKYLDVLGNRNLEPAGLPAPADTPSAAANGAGNLTGTLTFYVSRYNALTGVESNAKACAEITVSAKKVAIGVEDVNLDPGHATHIRIYHSRADGFGFPGLIAEVEIDPTATDFDYDVGDAAVGNEGNGGATYAVADDDTNINYVPCSQNDPPPADTIDMVFWRNRMIYLTSGGLIYFSQSVEELQGHVEHVGALNYRRVPLSEKPVALWVLDEQLYVFTNKRIHRISGEFNSATNAQVVLGTLADEVVSTDALDKVAGTAGCVSRGGIIEVETDSGDALFYPGPAHVYRFNGENSVAVTERRIQGRYRTRRAAATDKLITAGHYKREGLVLFCFQDVSVLAYDYTTGEWVEWMTDHTRKFGPMCARAINGDEADDAILLQNTTTGAFDFNFEFRTFDTDLPGADYLSSAQPIFAWWLGPDLNMGYPHREKMFVFIQAFFEMNADYEFGKLALYGRRNGQSSEQYPVHSLETTKWDQDLDAEVEVVECLGFAGRSCQPYFEFSRVATGEVSVLRGYGLEYTIMGRR